MGEGYRLIGLAAVAAGGGGGTRVRRAAGAAENEGRRLRRLGGEGPATGPAVVTAGRGGRRCVGDATGAEGNAGRARGLAAATGGGLRGVRVLAVGVCSTMRLCESKGRVFPTYTVGSGSSVAMLKGAPVLSTIHRWVGVSSAPCSTLFFVVYKPAVVSSAWMPLICDLPK